VNKLLNQFSRKNVGMNFDAFNNQFLLLFFGVVSAAKVTDKLKLISENFESSRDVKHVNIEENVIG
jgi:hypothetical protein